MTRKSKVTIQDIADALGISRNTASKALNGVESIPTVTRDKVVKKQWSLNTNNFLIWKQLLKNKAISHF